MKRIIILIALLFIFPCLNIYAEETTQDCLSTDIQIQKRISDIGYRLLNANKIDVRMIFVYQNKEKFVKVEPGLMKRQIIIYDKTMQFASSDDEIAAYLAREICKSAESYTGIFKGYVSSAQVKMAPKKYELFFDKRAVDFMVMAGYNPIAFITFIHKSQPQKRYDKVSRHNLTSKRLANIYEYIYTKYPYFLNNNEYLDNETYKHFLLSSIENRKKLNEKIKSGLKKAVDYE